MPSLKDLSTTDLHLHILGAYTTQDFFVLGKDVYRDVNWNEEGFVDRYNELYETSLDPIGIFDRAVEDAAGLEELRRAYVYTVEDGGDFGKWETKNGFFLRVWSHLRELDREGDLLRHMLARYKTEGYRYVEYRCGSGMDGFMFWHPFCARALQASSDASFTARYIVSIPRHAAEDAYRLTRDLLQKHPELVETLVGVDFASVEEGNPPKHVAPLLTQLEADNKARPDQALDVVYHVGEQYFDKSLESAIRWCHEVAELGVRRLGHAIALGLDARTALARRPGAHERESVEERLDQIAYDLDRAEELSEYGVVVKENELKSERRRLEAMDPGEVVRSHYDMPRISNIHARQEYVLDELARLGTAIECCPTSNLRIGCIPHPGAHPIHRFLESEVDLAICTDDPGGFEITLEEELNWVVKHSGLSETAVIDRLGDPWALRLGQRREAG